jgi:putative tryptophan/tyrosine transport system substrate-binding protein
VRFSLLFLRLILLLSLQFASGLLYAKNLGVVYPNSSSKAIKYYQVIIDNIKKNSTHTVIIKTLERKTKANDIKQWIDKNQIVGLVTLSKYSKKIVNKLDLSIPVIHASSNFIKPSKHYQVNLIVSPRVFNKFIPSLTPNVKKIHVVVHRNLKWAFDHINHPSLSYQFHEINNAKEMIISYKTILKSMNKNETILMGYEGFKVHRKMIKNLLLKAWKKKVPLYTQNVVYVKKGMLLGVFNDFNQYGQQIAKLLNKIFSGVKVKKTHLSNNYHLAFNRRTAKYLDANIDNDAYTIVFPNKK